MLTYQVRPRVFRLEEGQALSFPADVQINFHFCPLQPFGMEAGGGHTAVRAVEARAQFNANTGAHSVASSVPLQPLAVKIEEPTRSVVWEGNLLSVSQHFDTIDALNSTIEGIYFALPMLLAVKFADPPFVERVYGTIGDTSFRWELRYWRAGFQTTTQDEQQSAIGLSWGRLDVLSAPGRRRVLAALHYFHVACRLSRQGVTIGEFLAEAVLNFAKVLEVLFPREGNAGTRDAARTRLIELGFSETEIEADYIPAMALRNEIDSGHVELSLFNQDELSLIHSYVFHAEKAFQVLLDRLLTKIAAGEFEITPYDVEPVGPKASAVIKRLRQHAERYKRGFPTETPAVPS